MPSSWPLIWPCPSLGLSPWPSRLPLSATSSSRCLRGTRRSLASPRLSGWCSSAAEGRAEPAARNTPEERAGRSVLIQCVATAAASSPTAVATWAEVMVLSERAGATTTKATTRPRCRLRIGRSVSPSSAASLEPTSSMSRRWQVQLCLLIPALGRSARKPGGT